MPDHLGYAIDVVGPSNWRFDPFVIVLASLACGAYAAAAARYRSRRRRPWPALRRTWFFIGLGSAVLAIESPLDAAGDLHFAPHMVQHLVLTDVSAPCLLLGGPFLLFLSVVRTDTARRIGRWFRSPVGRLLTSPIVTWLIFILALWGTHDTTFFELALESESAHALEHAIYLATALLFWLPVIEIGPTPWSNDQLAYPLRMLYLFAAMPAEAMLGFTINGARHILYAHYANAGMGDQQAAGEIMWVGGSVLMFAAFMVVGYRWAQHEERLNV